MSEDAPVTTTTPQTHAAWTPEGEVKPPAPKVSEDAVVAAISSVYDPETKKLETGQVLEGRLTEIQLDVLRNAGLKYGIGAQQIGTTLAYAKALACDPSDNWIAPTTLSLQ